MERKEDSINSEQSLNPCGEKSPLVNKLNCDPTPKWCNDDGTPNINKVSDAQQAWFEENRNKKTGFGKSATCDPVQSGKIIHDPADPDPRYIHRYTQGLRGADEAMLDMFRGVVVIDEDGKAHNVPIIWATQEKAVAAVMQDNVRKDNTLVVDRIRLPMLAIHSIDTQPQMARYTYHKAQRHERDYNDKPNFTIQEKRVKDTVFGYSRGIPVDISYTLYAWTLYVEDMNQIAEQIFSKFSPVAYINVKGVYWEVPVRLESTGNNIDAEPGDQAIRVIKWQFNMTAESYIPQPIERKKAVLKIRQTITDEIEEEDISEVINKIEIAVKELE